MTINRFAARGMIVRVLGRRIASFYAEFKTGFNLATAMVAKHFRRLDVLSLTWRCRHVGRGKSWEWVPSRLSLIITEQVPSPLICVSRNWFVFREIGLCFEKLICVLRNWLVFWEIDLCFEKLICVLRNWFVFWETNLCFGKLICDWPFWATVIPGYLVDDSAILGKIYHIRYEH